MMKKTIDDGATAKVGGKTGTQGTGNEMANTQAALEIKCSPVVPQEAVPGVATTPVAKDKKSKLKPGVASRPHGARNPVNTDVEGEIEP
ncbi:MAG: hypothetical protein NT118_16155 [Lentisphaerae bacterium]|nr:hypothetical protein [Lentisphaerota bacterium]